MIKKKVMEIMGGGKNCSQTVVLYFAERFSLDKSMAEKISKAFESGMFKGDQCGAVSGALMVIGLAFSKGSQDNRALLKEKTEEFMLEFKKRMGSTVCEDLLGINISTDENLKEAFESGKIANTCPNAVINAIEILETMLV